MQGLWQQYRQDDKGREEVGDKEAQGVSQAWWMSEKPDTDKEICGMGEGSRFCRD